MSIKEIVKAQKESLITYAQRTQRKFPKTQIPKLSFPMMIESENIEAERIENSTVRFLSPCLFSNQINPSE